MCVCIKATKRANRFNLENNFKLGIDLPLEVFEEDIPLEVFEETANSPLGILGNVYQPWMQILTKSS